MGPRKNFREIQARLVKYYNLARLLSYGKDGHQPEIVGVYVTHHKDPL